MTFWNARLRALLLIAITDEGWELAEILKSIITSFKLIDKQLKLIANEAPNYAFFAVVWLK